MKSTVVNELEKVFDTSIAIPYKNKIKLIEDHLLANADGVNIVGDGKEITYAENLWEYNHTFVDGIYVREMRMKKGQLAFSAIHKHSYIFSLLSGILLTSSESGVEEFIGPCYVISPKGIKRVVYAIEDCVIATIHSNPTNTEDLNELAKINIAANWNEYEEYVKKNK
jgi:hypothetical protein